MSSLAKFFIKSVEIENQSFSIRKLMFGSYTGKASVSQRKDGTSMEFIDKIIEAIKTLVAKIQEMIAGIRERNDQ